MSFLKGLKIIKDQGWWLTFRDLFGKELLDVFLSAEEVLINYDVYQLRDFFSQGSPLYFKSLVVEVPIMFETIKGDMMFTDAEHDIIDNV